MVTSSPQLEGRTSWANFRDGENGRMCCWSKPDQLELRKAHVYFCVTFMLIPYKWFKVQRMQVFTSLMPSRGCLTLLCCFYWSWICCFDSLSLCVALICIDILRCQCTNKAPVQSQIRGFTGRLQLGPQFIYLLRGFSAVKLYQDIAIQTYWLHNVDHTCCGRAISLLQLASQVQLIYLIQDMCS